MGLARFHLKCLDVSPSSLSMLKVIINLILKLLNMFSLVIHNKEGIQILSLITLLPRNFLFLWVSLLLKTKPSSLILIFKGSLLSSYEDKIDLNLPNLPNSSLIVPIIFIESTSILKEKIVKSCSNTNLRIWTHNRY